MVQRLVGLQSTGDSRVRSVFSDYNEESILSVGDASMTREDFLIGDNRDFQAILYDYVFPPPLRVQQLTHPQAPPPTGSSRLQRHLRPQHGLQYGNHNLHQKFQFSHFPIIQRWLRLPTPKIKRSLHRIDVHPRGIREWYNRRSHTSYYWIFLPESDVPTWVASSQDSGVRNEASGVE